MRLVFNRPDCSLRSTWSPSGSLPQPPVDGGQARPQRRGGWSLSDPHTLIHNTPTRSPIVSTVPVALATAIPLCAGTAAAHFCNLLLRDGWRQAARWVGRQAPSYSFFFSRILAPRPPPLLKQSHTQVPAIDTQQRRALPRRQCSPGCCPMWDLTLTHHIGSTVEGSSDALPHLVA